MRRYFAQFLMMIALVVGSHASAGDVGVGQYNLPGKPPYLLAHYMQWYSTPASKLNGSAIDRSAPIWSHWRWEGKNAHHDPASKLDNGHRDIASVLYPLIGTYDSSSANVIRYHLATMKAAGVVGVTAIWYGPGSDTDVRFSLLLNEAAKLQMRVAICYEEKLNFPPYRHPKNREDVVNSAAKDFKYILSRYVNHPAYLKRNGLPIVVQFNGYGKSNVGQNNLSVDEFKRDFAMLPAKIALVRQNLNEDYHPAIPGAYVWWTQNDWPQRFAKRCAELRNDGKLEFFMTMICPGFDDTGVWGWGAGARKSKGYGIEVWQWTMKQALDGGPELVQMVTWNDFNEATCFEPTVQHGYEFLDATEKWWGGVTGRAVNLDDNRKPLREYLSSCSQAEKAEVPVETLKKYAE